MTGQKPITVGVIGLGRAGYNIHIKRMRDDGRFVVAGVTDWMPERSAEVAAELGCPSYGSYREMLRRCDCEAVVVASASSTHPAVTRDAFAAGKHVICEKPMAAGTRSAQSMIRAGEKAGKLLFMHHNRRFSAEFLHLMDIVQNGPIGRVFEIRMRYLAFRRRDDWQTMRKFDGGQLNNTGSHYLDLGLQLLGSPVKQVYCNLQQIASAGDCEDHVKVLLTAENGRVWDMELSTACKFPEPKWTILGTYGTIISDGSTSQVEFFDPAQVPPMEATEVPSAQRRYDNDDVLPWQSMELSAADAPKIGDFYDNFWAVLREGAKMVVKPEETLEVVRIIEACRRVSAFYK